MLRSLAVLQGPRAWMFAIGDTMPHTPSDVLPNCDQFHVVRIDTATNPTFVVDHQAVRNLAVSQFPRNDMGAAEFHLVLDAPITTVIQRTKPKETA